MRLSLHTYPCTLSVLLHTYSSSFPTAAPSPFSNPACSAPHTPYSCSFLAPAPLPLLTLLLSSSSLKPPSCRLRWTVCWAATTRPSKARAVWTGETHPQLEQGVSEMTLQIIWILIDYTIPPLPVVVYTCGPHVCEQSSVLLPNVSKAHIAKQGQCAQYRVYSAVHIVQCSVQCVQWAGGLRQLPGI